MLQDKDLVSIQEARQLVEQAHQAVEEFKTYSQEKTDAIVRAAAEAAQKESRRLAELAVRETGYGKVADKVIKNLFASTDVYNYLKGLKTCGVVSENKDKGVIDIAVPTGVIAAVIPTTNPTSTAIFKILCALKGRNAIVISPHPNAQECTIETARVMAEGARSQGAPENVVSWMTEVTLEGTHELMRYPKTGLILATGGAGLVKAAYSSGKPAFGVGPGNVPAYIERTADVPKAVRDVIAGKTFDNGVLCSSEQALIYDRVIEEQVLAELDKNNAYLVDTDELEKLERTVQTSQKRLNTAIVGKSAQEIAKMAGFSVPDHVVCLVGRARGVGPEHPLSREKLSPVLALYDVEDWEEGCRRCIEILSYGGLGHTMAIHSTDRAIILEFGLHKPAYRICVNTPATHGSVGLTTGVPPSMTLGCGTPGGNITSDNITPLHLINIRRVAFEQRSVDEIEYPTDATPPSVSRTQQAGAIRDAVRSVVEGYLRQKEREPASAALDSPSPAAQPPTHVEPPARQPVGPPVDFVAEEDVRAALRDKKKIVITERTILTPSARELGEDRKIFIIDAV